MSNKLFIFDMDGVLVQTIEALYQTYLNILAKFGVNGNREEFNLLGGKLSEIVSYLKRKHNLKISEDELLKEYDEQTSLIYSNVRLINNVEAMLKRLKKNKFKIALASSSNMKNIQLVLEKFNLKIYFDFIVSGEDVNEAKPSPEIYNLVKNRFKNHEYYVIEDSRPGIDSAISADMRVIFFNPNKQELEKDTEYSISEMKELRQIIAEIKAKCKTIIIYSNIEVTLKGHMLEITTEQEKVIDQVWKKEKEKKPSLFNGKIISYLSHTIEKDKLIIECFLTEYKYFLANLKNPYLGLNIAPLAVSGIISDKSNNILIGKRSSKVTEYSGFYEFIPSGSIDVSNTRQNKILFRNQLKKEVEEETNLNAKDIESIDPICLVLDKSHNVYDICCKIILKENINLKTYGINVKEYYAPKIINLSSLERFIKDKEKEFVPTSKILWRTIQEGKQW